MNKKLTGVVGLVVVAAIIKGFPLYISRILRNGEYTPAYIAGRQGGLNYLKVI